MSRAWIITKDYIALAEKPVGTNSNAIGVTGPRNAPDDLVAQLKKGGGYAFVMKDDDGEIYYRGRNIWTDDEDLEMSVVGPLEDFGTPNAGCTMIDYPKHPEWNCG